MAALPNSSQTSCQHGAQTADEPLRLYASQLFGDQKLADCVLKFCIADDSSTGSRARTFVGEPIPGHRLVLLAGSELLNAQHERWKPCSKVNTEGAGAVGKTDGAKKGRLGGKRKRQDDHNTAPPEQAEGLPEIPLLLGSEADVQPALAAVRFMYTRNLDKGGSGSNGSCNVRDLLLIYRQAAYLQVYGCKEACIQGIVAHFEGSGSSGAPSSSSPSSSRPSGSPPLSAAVELHRCHQEQLLPSLEDDPAVATVHLACLRHLLRNWGEGLPPPRVQRRGTGGGASAASSSTAVLLSPSKVQLLAWLLGGGDALRVANDPQLMQQWLALPLGALEELLQLQEGGLRTDDESTVVLLVELWLEANAGRARTAAGAAGAAASAAEDAALRVRRQLRLVNCNASYLLDVLPYFGWAAKDGLAAFLGRCRMSPRESWPSLAQAHGFGAGTGSPWFGRARPQALPAEGVSFKWEIGGSELAASMKSQPPHAYPRFKVQYCATETVDRVVAQGFEWRVRLDTATKKDRCGVSLECRVPDAIQALVGPGRRLKGGAVVRARVEVWDGKQGAGKVLSFHVYMLEYGGARGWPEFITLSPGGAAARGSGSAAGKAGGEAGAEVDAEAALLEPWRAYLGRDNKVTGALTFLPLRQ